MQPVTFPPNLAAPDTDPYLWLEDVDGPEAVAWVEARSEETRARFAGAALEADQDALAEIMDRPDNIPFVIRRGGLLYNFWRDAAQPRGLWRRTTLESFRQAKPVWESVLDIDALAEAEGEDWVMQGSSVLPGGTLAMVSLSRGGGDASVLREFDLATCRFVAGGFALPEAKGSASWIDRDTLLVASALGDGMATLSGYARSLRRWRRGTDFAAAEVIFETTQDHMAVGGGLDRDDPAGRLVLMDRTDFFNGETCLLTADGARTRIDLPSDAGFSWHRGWLVVRPRSPWVLGAHTHAPGSVHVIRFDAFLTGDRGFSTLFSPGERCTSSGYFWSDGRLVVAVLDDLAPRHLVFTPGPAGWTEGSLGCLPEIGVVGVSALDADIDEGDGTLIASAQDPLTPVTLMLTDTAGKAPEILKRAPVAFNAAGLAVTRHEAISIDGVRIPYFQTGPSGETGEAPVHMHGYGGFAVSELPYYRGGIGKVWLERGGTTVTTNLRGGGEFGPAWHDAGKRQGKALTHDDFAAIAADLVRRGVTRPGRIAAEGGSNGGILITNMLTRYPERFGALFCTIPLIDMRRYNKLLAGASWVAEYGDPDRPEDWAFLQHISAYHTVVANPQAPPILIATTRRDDRVHPGHARKMAAKLLAMQQRAWFFELDAGGHSYGKTNRERAYFSALGFAFMRDAIGWTPAEPAA